MQFVLFFGLSQVSKYYTVFRYYKWEVDHESMVCDSFLWMPNETLPQRRQVHQQVDLKVDLPATRCRSALHYISVTM